MTADSASAPGDLLSFDITVRFPLRLAFTRGLFDPANPLLASLLEGGPAERVLCIVDANLLAAHPTLAARIETALDRMPVRSAGPPLILQGGESIKNDPGALTQIHRAISKAGLSRHSYVLAVGGGALLDVAGFASATAHRGIRLIRVPTTTLSQADGGVGVKNGINALGRKNFIGTFAPPVAVVNDFTLLAGLPAREMRAGSVEALKVALIRDATFFEHIERDADRLARFEPAAVETLIRRSAELHLRHIAEGGDPFESGSSRPLDFGHWSAHQLEQLSGWQVGHGDAVACGVALDTLYSAASGLLAEAEVTRVLALLGRLGFPTWFPEMSRPGPDGPPALLAGIEAFREHLGGGLCIPLLAGIGQMIEASSIDPDRMSACIRRLAEHSTPS